MVTQPASSARSGGANVARFIFDFDRAEADIARMRVALAKAHTAENEETDALGTELEGIEIGPATPTDPDAAIVAMSGYSDERGPRAQRVQRRAPVDGALDPELDGTRRALSPADVTGAREQARAAEVLRRRSQAPLPAAGISQPVRCQTAGMKCWGCNEDIEHDAWMIPGGPGMIHNLAACYQTAALEMAQRASDLVRAEEVRRRLQEGPSATFQLGAGVAPDEICPACPVDTSELGPSIRESSLASAVTMKPDKADQNQRVAQMDETLSEARRGMVRLCMQGQCAHRGSDEPVMTCIGSCHRQLHGVKCAQLSQGHAVLAVFECPECRLKAIIDGEPPYTEAAVRGAEETMLLEMSRGAEQSGAAYSDFVKLQSEWALDVGGGARVKLPSDSPVSLKMFLTWLVRDKERARSLGSLWRAIGSYMIKSGRPNLTADTGVKAHFASLLETHGVEEVPRTAATPRMVNLICAGSQVTEKHCPKPIIAARTKLDVGMEAGCGVRVGEAMGSGDYHGVKAGHMAILRQVDTGLETVEMMLEHSKTKHKRWSNCLGTTLGTAQLPLAALLRKYWKEAKLQVVTFVEGGHEVTTVDYWVARVTMLGMTDAQYETVGRVLARSSVASVRRAAVATMARAKKRRDAKLSKDKRYINVMGGAHGSTDLAEVVLELTQAGLGSFVRVVEGPLLRSTDMGGDQLSHMPLDPSSTYETLHKIMDDAYELANPEGDPDPWLDMQGLESPLWGHHSFRRCADTVARATMARSGVSEQDIDLVFGWLEAMYSHRMQYHYETRFIRDKRYRVTMYL